MADSYEKRRRRKGRYDTGARGDDNNVSSSSSPQSQSQSQGATGTAKPPMRILGLAKPSRAQGEVPTHPRVDNYDTSNVSQSSVSTEAGVDKFPVTVLSDSRHQPSSNSKSVSDVESVEYRRSHPSSMSVSHSELLHAKDNNPQYTHLRKPTIPSSVMTGSSELGGQSLQAKLAAPNEKLTRTKIIDEGLQWLDSGFDLMLDQTDFLVVAIIGSQGCGKSTILSLLAGNSQQDAYRNYIFSPQSKETKEDCMFQTAGIDMYVSQERIIYLDCQPLLSPAVMDCLIRYDRKLPSEYSSLQNLVEMQSMQLLTFLLSVCNIVLIADDWFIDVNLLRFIQDAEMLKPSQSPSMPSEGSPNKEDASDFFPTVVFVHNKATREDFSPQIYHSMQTVLQGVFSSSKLKYKTGINMNNDSFGESIINALPGKGNNGACDINLILLPIFEFYKCEPESLDITLPDYRGYPSFNTIFSFFRSQILGGPRSPLTHSTLTEKNWYHFAARMWESVKKSSLLAEYNRLSSNS